MKEFDFTENIINSEVNQIIHNLVKELPPLEKEIVMLYFGFYNNTRYALREIAVKISRSHEYVYQILKGTINLLTVKLKRQGIIEAKKRQLSKAKKRR